MDIFKTRDYSKKSVGRLIEKDCIICNRIFSVPFGRRNVVNTCCKYCQNLVLSWRKNQGRYILCKMCDKPIWVMPSRNHKFCSRKCHSLAMSVFPEEMNLQILQTGRKKYYGSNWISQRKRTRKRDEYTCQRCGITEKEYGHELSVHHKTPFVYFETYLEANQLENLVSLCEPCHRKIHSGENHTLNFDKEKIAKTVKYLSNNGFVIGNHTLDHKRLSELDDKEFFRQVGESKFILEEKLNKYCDYFAWPYGQQKDITDFQVDEVSKIHKYIFSGCDYTKYKSRGRLVINRRHFEPFWPSRHLNFFLSREKN